MLPYATNAKSLNETFSAAMSATLCFAQGAGTSNYLIEGIDWAQAGYHMKRHP